MYIWNAETDVDHFFLLQLGKNRSGMPPQNSMLETNFHDVDLVTEKSGAQSCF